MHIVDEVNDPIVTGMKVECAGYSNELRYPKGTGVMVPDEYVRRVVDEAVTEMKRRLDEYGIPTLARMKCPSSSDCAKDEDGCSEHCEPHIWTEGCDYGADGCPSCVPNAGGEA